MYNSQSRFFNDYDPQTAGLFLLACVAAARRGKREHFFLSFSYSARSPICAIDHMLNNTASCLLFQLHFVHSIF